MSAVLYNTKTKGEFTNKDTGEVFGIEMTNVAKAFVRHPINSKSKRTVYMDQFERILELTKTQQILLFELLKNVDDYNILTKSFKEVGAKITSDDSRLSKEVKALKDTEFISKIEKVWMINPFYVLPSYSNSEPEKYWKLQQIWKLYNEDCNITWENMDYDIEEIINHSRPKSKWIKIKNKFFTSPAGEE